MGSLKTYDSMNSDYDAPLCVALLAPSAHSGKNLFMRVPVPVLTQCLCALVSACALQSARDSADRRRAGRIVGVDRMTALREFRRMDPSGWVEES